MLHFSCEYASEWVDFWVCQARVCVTCLCACVCVCVRTWVCLCTCVCVCEGELWEGKGHVPNIVTGTDKAPTVAEWMNGYLWGFVHVPTWVQIWAVFLRLRLRMFEQAWRDGLSYIWLCLGFCKCNLTMWGQWNFLAVSDPEYAPIPFSGALPACRAFLPRSVEPSPHVGPLLQCVFRRTQMAGAGNRKHLATKQQFTLQSLWYSSQQCLLWWAQRAECRCQCAIRQELRCCAALITSTYCQVLLRILPLGTREPLVLATDFRNLLGLGLLQSSQ